MVEVKVARGLDYLATQVMKRDEECDTLTGWETEAFYITSA